MGLLECLSLRLVDEEWFFKTHIIIESEGGHVISSLEAAFLALQACLRMKCACYSFLNLETSRSALLQVPSKCRPFPDKCSRKAISCAMKDENIHNLHRSRNEGSQVSDFPPQAGVEQHLLGMACFRLRCSSGCKSCTPWRRPCGGSPLCACLSCSSA